MESVRISHPNGIINGTINLPSSKSLSNRALILKSLYATHLEIGDLSSAKDTYILEKALKKDSININIEDAGTAARFMTAYLAITPGEFILFGTARMHQRPIKPLVDALSKLGAQIEYLDKSGFLPLKINGVELKGGTIDIDGSMSSQYISALMLIGASLKQGLEIRYKGKLVSQPYINMTYEMLKAFGIDTYWDNHCILIKPFKKKNAIAHLEIEKDWSSAVYWFLMLSLAKEGEIFLRKLNIYTQQADAYFVGIANNFGIEMKQSQEGVELRKNVKSFLPPQGIINRKNAPDAALTEMMMYAVSGQKAMFQGLEHLKFKESDRVGAMAYNLRLFGGNLNEEDDGLRLLPIQEWTENNIIKCFNDHRIAMNFATLGLKTPVIIDSASVVSKSYPNYWNDLKKVGFHVEEL